jgi:hypothetical protein
VGVLTAVGVAGGGVGRGVSRLAGFKGGGVGAGATGAMPHPDASISTNRLRTGTNRRIEDARQRQSYPRGAADSTISRTRGYTYSAEGA